MIHRFAVFTLTVCFLNAVSLAQPPGRRFPPQFNSTQVSPERKITFRVYAPDAQEARLSSSDIPDMRDAPAMTKNDEGIWEMTVGPVPAGAYRYTFNVDGLDFADPRNPATSESNANSVSLVTVPGSELFDTKAVPHGNVAKVTYFSKTLDRNRRMHVYTPPGYESGDGEFPVFYLLHGATDGDSSWSTVGRAGFILDNLIADGKAVSMIVVMPHGHTGPFVFGMTNNSFEKQMSDFQKDFESEVRPYIESHYRTINDRQHRAIAGLSMGGAQTLNIAFDNLADYAYVGVYSSGIFGIAGGFGGGEPNTQWEQSHLETLDKANLKDGLTLFWFGTGKDDFLLNTTQATVKMFKDHGFDVKYDETKGGHTWLVWRDYLSEFAPKLFRTN